MKQIFSKNVITIDKIIFILKEKNEKIIEEKCKKNCSSSNQMAQSYTIYFIDPISCIYQFPYPTHSVYLFHKIKHCFLLYEQIKKIGFLSFYMFNSQYNK